MTVVVAAEGYPGPPRLGDVDHRRRGRRACCTPAPAAATTAPWCPPAAGCCRWSGTGDDLAAARADAYRRLDGVHLAGSHHRTDIALRAARGEVAVPTPALISGPALEVVRP